MDEITVIFPCLNEAAALPGVLRALPPGYRAMVVDNGSTDESADIARRHGATVISQPHKGYGSAVHSGLLAASTDIVCFCDADGSLDPALLPTLVRPLHDGADLAVGRRIPTEPGTWPWHARGGNLLLATILRRQGVAVRDIGPVRAGRRRALLDLKVTDRGFGYPLELLLRAANAGWRVSEVDYPYRKRAEGTRSKVSGSLSGTARAMRDMSAVLAAHRRARKSQ